MEALCEIVPTLLFGFGLLCSEGGGAREATCGDLESRRGVTLRICAEATAATPMAVAMGCGSAGLVFCLCFSACTLGCMATLSTAS